MGWFLYHCKGRKQLWASKWTAMWYQVLDEIVRRVSPKTPSPA